MLELGRVAGLRVGLGQSTLVELGELGTNIVVLSLPSIKPYLYLSMFFVA
jgi:hypothetical protein